jgi:hypothetical protein
MNVHIQKLLQKVDFDNKHNYTAMQKLLHKRRAFKSYKTIVAHCDARRKTIVARAVMAALGSLCASRSSSRPLGGL